MLHNVTNSSTSDGLATFYGTADGKKTIDTMKELSFANIKEMIAKRGQIIQCEAKYIQDLIYVI